MVVGKRVEQNVYEQNIDRLNGGKVARVQSFEIFANVFWPSCNRYLVVPGTFYQYIYFPYFDTPDFIHDFYLGVHKYRYDIA